MAMINCFPVKLLPAKERTACKRKGHSQGKLGATVCLFFYLSVACTLKDALQSHLKMHHIQERSHLKQHSELLKCHNLVPHMWQEDDQTDLAASQVCAPDELSFQPPRGLLLHSACSLVSASSKLSVSLLSVSVMWPLQLCARQHKPRVTSFFTVLFSMFSAKKNRKTSCLHNNNYPAALEKYC